MLRRRPSRKRARASAVLLALLVMGCAPRRSAPEPGHRDHFTTSTDQPIVPLPLEVESDRRRAELGELLFREPLLSGDGKVACSTCHVDGRALADERRLSEAPDRPPTPVNSPTMYNVRYLYKLAWGANFDSLPEHNDALMVNPAIMASSWEMAAEHLGTKASYVKHFADVFPEGLNAANVRSALLEYEWSLVTPNAPFDRFLRGETDAISSKAKRGYALFKSYGCASCHQGQGVGGNMLQRLGVMRDYFAERGKVTAPDHGQFNRTKREKDRFVFRVPSLRNVALTPPYFHDGTVKTLEDAVRAMARYQLGREFRAEEVAAIAEFLRSLTGEYRGKAP